MALTSLSKQCLDLLDAEIPEFSAREMRRRREALSVEMDKAGVDALVLYGANRAGAAIQWITSWPVTAEGLCVFQPDRRDTLFVEYFNHIPQATKIAHEADVRPAGSSMIEAAIDELKARKIAFGRLGVIGPLGHAGFAKLEAQFGAIANLNKAYTGLRLIKSDEEIDWLTIGARLSDAAIAAMEQKLEPGMCERDLADLVERAYVPLGGTTHIHFFGISSMDEPSQYVPAQYTSNREIKAGDIVFCEISASFWNYPGQVLRSFAIQAGPPPLYQKLYDIAERAYEAITATLRDGATAEQVVQASNMIEEAGFTTCDDMVHGFGGGYFPPILGSASRPAGPLPDMSFKTGMTVVVQPNVISPEYNAGVQLGELVLITETGIEPLHQAPQKFFRV